MQIVYLRDVQSNRIQGILLLENIILVVTFPVESKGGNKALGTNPLFVCALH